MRILSEKKCSIFWWMEMFTVSDIIACCRCFQKQNEWLVHGHTQSIYIRTVSSWHLLSGMLNWLKLVQGSFGQSNMHKTSQEGVECKVGFFQKGLMNLSFLQTNEPNYFPELKFWFSFIKWLKSCQIRTWSWSNALFEHSE